MTVHRSRRLKQDKNKKNEETPGRRPKKTRTQRRWERERCGGKLVPARRWIPSRPNIHRAIGTEELRRRRQHTRRPMEE